MWKLVEQLDRIESKVSGPTYRGPASPPDVAQPAIESTSTAYVNKEQIDYILRLVGEVIKCEDPSNWRDQVHKMHEKQMKEMAVREEKYRKEEAERWAKMSEEEKKWHRQMFQTQLVEPRFALPKFVQNLLTER